MDLRRSRHELTLTRHPDPIEPANRWPTFAVVAVWVVIGVLALLLR